MGSPMLANARVGISKRLVLSYIIDWILIMYDAPILFSLLVGNLDINVLAAVVSHLLDMAFLA